MRTKVWEARDIDLGSIVDVLHCLMEQIQELQDDVYIMISHRKEVDE